ncbi:MAG: hypothetical protein K9H25_08880 [Rhodospirillum sp.]|nr:hypothetical protein [Rhodospirillum sp.]MCF8489410.1 hypothetical protein [Rhodospirillum sp.]
MAHSPSFPHVLKVLRYRLDMIFGMGLPAQLGLLAVTAGTAATLGGVVFSLLLSDPDNADAAGLPRSLDGGILDGLWWAARRVLDPGATENDYAAAWQLLLLSLCLTLVGMALFGTLIALVSTHVGQRLRILEQGTGPVMEEDHVLVLGHGRRARAVIRRVLETGPRKVVVLADDDPQEIRAALAATIPRKDLRRVVIRRGRPSLPSDLERVNVAHAGRVVVMAADRSETDPVANDIEVIKTLAALSAVDWPDNRRPPMAAEVVDVDDLEVAKVAGNYQVPVLTTGDVISKLIVQCARQPGLSQVFSAVFGSTEVTLHLVAEPTLANRPMAEAMRSYTDSIPLGVCDVLELDDREILIPDINPPDGRVIEPQERVILLGPPKAAPIGSPRPAPEITLPDVPEGGPRTARNIVILGWNKNIPAILSNFDEHMRDGGETGGSVTLVGNPPPETMAELIATDLPRPPQNLALTFLNRPWLRRRHLVDLVADADTVVLLSDQSGGIEDPDARVIMGLILLDSLAAAGQAHPDLHVVAEMVDGSNARLMERRVGGTLRPELIVSPDVVSLLLIRIAENNILRVIVTEFLSAKGQEIYLKPAKAYVHAGEAVDFSGLMDRARARSEIALGLALHRENAPPEILINPPRGTLYTLNKADRVIVVALDIKWRTG